MDMNGHSAESYTAVWTFKTAFEQAGTDDGETVKDVLTKIDIRESFPDGRRSFCPTTGSSSRIMNLTGSGIIIIISTLP